MQQIGEAMKFIRAVAESPNLAIDAIGDALIDVVRCKISSKPVPASWSELLIANGYTAEQAAFLWTAAWKVALNG